MGANFRVGGHVWALKLYPSGDTKARDPSSIPLYLYLDPECKTDVKVSFTFRLLNQRTDNSHWVKKSEVDEKFFIFAQERSSTRSPDWGFADFILSSKLAEDGYLKDDSLIIEAEIEILDAVQVKTSEVSYSFDFPVNQLGTDLLTMLQSGVQSDVTIIVEGDQEIKAHRNILSLRSPVFRAMFQHEMKESKDQIVDIKDCSRFVLDLMLEYIYTGDIHTKITSWDQAISLFSMADRYGLERLTLLCVPLIAPFLSNDTLSHTLEIAQAHSSCLGSEQLIQVTKSYAIEHVVQLIQHTGQQYAHQQQYMGSLQPSSSSSSHHQLSSSQSLPSHQTHKRQRLD